MLAVITIIAATVVVVIAISFGWLSCVDPMRLQVDELSDMRLQRETGARLGMAGPGGISTLFFCG